FRVPGEELPAVGFAAGPQVLQVLLQGQEGLPVRRGRRGVSRQRRAGIIGLPVFGRVHGPILPREDEPQTDAISESRKRRVGSVPSRARSESASGVSDLREGRAAYFARRLAACAARAEGRLAGDIAAEEPAVELQAGVRDTNDDAEELDAADLVSLEPFAA